MIVLSAFQCEQSNNFKSLSCDVTHKSLPKKLFFDCHGNNLLRVNAPGCNWAAVAMLFPAMVIGEDLLIEGPVSPRLLFALNGDVQSLLLAYQPKLMRIRVIAETCEPTQIIAGTEVATGFSAGIDSFATLNIYAREKVPEGMGVTTLTMFNVGAMGGARLSRNLFPKYCERLKEYADRFDYNWQSADSNLDRFYRSDISNIMDTHTLRNIACAYLFEDQYKTYLYSSSVPYKDIKAVNFGMGAIEPMLLPLLATEKVKLISAGAGLSRVEKTLLVSEMESGAGLLDVCVANPEGRAAAKYINCGKCWKCARTLVNLDAIGKLEQFSNAFDLEKFSSGKAKAIRKVIWKALKGQPLDRELVSFLYASHYREIPVWLKMFCLLGCQKY